MSGAATILLGIVGCVATITLNRPGKLNAFAGDMRERLIDALDEVAGTRGVRVLVLTGAGKGCCSVGDAQHMVDLKQRGADAREGPAAIVAKRAPRLGADALAENSRPPSAAARRFE